MPHSLSTQDVTSPGGLLLVLAVLVPFMVLAGMVLGGRGPQRVAFAILAAGLRHRHRHRRRTGAIWRCRGLHPGRLDAATCCAARRPAVIMLLAIAVVIGGIGVYAAG
ncbi:MAG: hypothetical protein R3F40_09345 [Candidatus Competibacteraceae bacterium]